MSPTATSSKKPFLTPPQAESAHSSGPLPPGILFYQMLMAYELDNVLTSEVMIIIIPILQGRN